jgi:hypothetical protein
MLTTLSTDVLVHDRQRALLQRAHEARLGASRPTGRLPRRARVGWWLVDVGMRLAAPGPA